MPKLNDGSLEFAKEHVRAFYASDFFPDADEFEALWMGWDDVRKYFAAADLKELGTTPEDMACAKSTGGFRIVHQLQPLDTLAYTALAHTIAPHLESKRIPENERVGCSYRLQPDTSGRFFKPNYDGFHVFTSQSVELSQTHEWVLLADIAGFYNHVYVHRIEGAIQDLDPALSAVANDAHEFLLNLNDRVSIGIPVGPAASIVFSELILNEIDQFTRAHRLHLSHTRYADDFRFFSNSKSDLAEFWHDLSAYLYRAQRLSLAATKSRIVSSGQFREMIIASDTNTRRAELAETLGVELSDFASMYPDEDAAKPERASTPERQEALKSLLNELLTDDELNVGITRQVLRRARSLRLRTVVRSVTESLEKLAPVIRDAALYLTTVLNETAISHNATSLEKFLSANPQYSRGSHLHYWTAFLLSGKRAASELSGFETFMDEALPRFRARAARVQDQPVWVRNNRNQWQKWATWDRWSLIHAAELLPEKERRAWMDSVSRSPDLTDRLVAAKVRSL